MSRIVTRWREHLLVAGILVLVFAAGGVSAIALMRVAELDAATTSSPFAGDRAGPDGPRAERGPPGRLAPELIDRMGLDSVQVHEAARILDQHNARSREILETLGPQLEAQLDSARSAIRILLSPEQQQIFDEYLEQHRGFTERRFGGGRGGRGREGRGSDARGGRRGRF